MQRVSAVAAANLRWGPPDQPPRRKHTPTHQAWRNESGAKLFTASKHCVTA